MIDNKKLITLASEMKAKMSLEERDLFVANCMEIDGLNFIDISYSKIGDSIYDVHSFLYNAFIWDLTYQGHGYWENIKKRF